MISNPNTSDSSAEQLRRDLVYTSRGLIPVLLVALLVVAAHVGATGAVTTALLWALACLVAGAAIGFLFGIPKVLQEGEAAPGKFGAASREGAPSKEVAPEAADEYRQRVNTNLTEISDWLTKIIVGLGLVNLHKLPPQIGGLAEILASGLNPTEPGKEKGFAVALIVCFSILGFLVGYLFTRLFLARAFERADKGQGEIDQPTERQLENAARVEQRVSADDISEIKAQLVSLAREYERIRSLMPFPSDERTRRMTQVVGKMRELALAGYPSLEEFANGQSPGERLVAVVMLQIRPNLNKLDWLAKRFKEESYFVAYHAGVALLQAVQTLGASASESLRSALEEAKLLAGDKLKDPDIANALAAAEKQLAGK